MTIRLDVMTYQGVEVDPKKVEAVKGYPRSLTPIDIQSFQGFAKYYCQFVEGFSTICDLFTTVTKKKMMFEWSKKCEKSFQELKYRLTSAPILTLSRSGTGFVVQCDASRVGLGCVLMQDCNVISCASRELKIHEKTYPTQDIELGDVVFALKLWRHYLYGVHVDVYTDHKSLQYVFMQRELNLCKMRWLELLKVFYMSVFYHSGKTNVVADALSQLSMRSMSHIDDEKKDLVKEVQQLA